MNSTAERDEGKRPCGFQENLGLLRQIDFFSVLPIDTQKVVAYLCARERYKAGEYLFHQGDDDGRAFYILSGAVAIDREGAGTDGRAVVIREYREGDFIGGLSLMGSMRRIFSARAKDDLACMVLTRERFTRAIEQFPELMPKVMRIAVERIRAWEEQFIFDCAVRCDHYKEKVGVSLI